MTHSHPLPIHVRTFRATDERALTPLQRQGRLLVGEQPHLDFTLKQVRASYFDRPPNHLWVAEAQGLLVGVAGLVHEQPMVARLQVLCVDPEWANQEIAEALIQTAVRHCHYFGYLKLVTPIACPTDELLPLFARTGLRFTRHRCDERGEPSMLEFYVDLYRRGEPVHSSSADEEASSRGALFRASPAIIPTRRPSRHPNHRPTPNPAFTPAAH